jgi:hypothetical protein
MTADAPTENLAAEYQRLIVEIDRSLGKLQELEGGAAPRESVAAPLAAIAAAPPPPRHPARNTEPGMRPLVTTPIGDVVEEGRDIPPADGESRSRVPLILLIAVVALALIGWLIWRASSDGAANENPVVPIVEESGTSASASTAPDTVDEAATPPPAAATALKVTPRAQEYGVIRKGTRATRQFDITNSSDEPVTIQVARSTCRCLFYEHAPVVPPKGKESLTVTVDGARAKAGELRETIKVSAKSNASLNTTFDVIATVR